MNIYFWVYLVALCLRILEIIYPTKDYLKTRQAQIDNGTYGQSTAVAYFMFVLWIMSFNY
jgi:hypothetical protein